MRYLGLLLLAATGAFTGLAIADNLSGGVDYSVTMLGNHIATLSPLGLFCSGLALALLFCLGIALMTHRATQHHHRHHRRTGTRRTVASTPPDLH
ncbi:hypothetical protein [Streptomyces beihaiensis]|uniref:Uncharacterized protein n=1 Tax=Streptomyces beihaiensis TaxID=2984495 RepID=A0ABT3TNF8_9ACTN|nr:hypothetical protein [Streptomyces beihaiensis]MCX3058574.1 hypothetical protein [Streptomyces beihaiensis]